MDLQILSSWTIPTTLSRLSGLRLVLHWTWSKHKTL